MTAQISIPDSSLPVRDKLAQLLFVRIGSNLPPVRTVEQDENRLADLLPRCPVGGLLLFNGQQDVSPATLARLQAISPYPLLVAADIERGVGQQLRGLPLLPHAMAFDTLGEDAAARVRQSARLTGELARRSGIHISFSPVADVNTDPRNPIIATRAFSSDADRVAELVTAYVTECQDAGLLATAKHFPGHGSTHEDSHHARPVIDCSAAELNRRELVPFQAAIAAGVSLIMTAHISYPSIDATGTPATLSSQILQGLLRGQLGFQGCVASDSLLMEGVKSHCDSEGELVVAALLAGVDALLDVEDPVAALDALERAVERGHVPVERVDQAFGRIVQLKHKVFEEQAVSASDDSGTQDGLSALIDETAELAMQVSRCAIRVLESGHPLLPFSKDRSLLAVTLIPHQSHLDPAEQPLASALRKQFSRCVYHELGPRSPDDIYDMLLRQAHQMEQVLAAIVVKPSAWHRLGLLPQQETFLKRLIEAKPCVLASLGTPDALREYTQASVKLCTFSDVPASQVALAEFLGGNSAA